MLTRALACDPETGRNLRDGARLSLRSGQSAHHFEPDGIAEGAKDFGDGHL
jgi:hypothetical protein